MSGDNEKMRKYRYVCECAVCGAMLSALDNAAGRKPGRFVRCRTEWETHDEPIECDTINWATDAAEHRPPRWSENRKPAEPPEELLEEFA